MLSCMSSMQVKSGSHTIRVPEAIIYFLSVLFPLDFIFIFFLSSAITSQNFKENLFFYIILGFFDYLSLYLF